MVILGDGPSHLPGIDHGLAFSSLKDSVPSNLVNIYKEVWISFKEEMQQRAGKKEVNFKDLDPNQLFYRADLTQWANQGVLLLNTVLTVEKNKPNSHNGIGWERFVAETLAFISESKDWLVFMLWGENAISYKKYIVCPEKHLILESARPDPLEANKGGWFGNHHFLKGNNFIESKKALTINYFVWEQ